MKLIKTDFINYIHNVLEIMIDWANAGKESIISNCGAGEDF